MVLTAKTIEDHAKLDFMNDIVGATMVWNLKLGARGQYTVQTMRM